MSDNYVGEIRLFPFNFAPKGWAVCAGQIMAISQNTALFSLLGTNYGGDGRSTFGLPNLQGSVILNSGQGLGLSPYVVGESGGSAAVTLLQPEMPNHNHSFNANTVDGTQNASTGQQLSKAQKGSRTGPSTVGALYSSNAANTTLAPYVLGTTGQNLPHNNLQPYLAMNYCIALTGVFPPRN